MIFFKLKHCFSCQLFPMNLIRKNSFPHKACEREWAQFKIHSIVHEFPAKEILNLQSNTVTLTNWHETQRFRFSHTHHAEKNGSFKSQRKRKQKNVFAYTLLFVFIRTLFGFQPLPNLGCNNPSASQISARNNFGLSNWRGARKQ